VVYVATEGPLGWAAVRTASHLGLPVFSGFHTNFHTYAQHYRLGWLRPLIFAYLRWFHGCTSGTLVPNSTLCAQLEAVGIPNVQVMGRGVDSQLFSSARRCAALRRAWGVTDQDLVVLYVGRLAAEKNLDTVIAAYRAMQDVSRTVRCVVVGDGPLRAPLQQAHPELIFCGMQTGLALARHYASADVFLFPSTTETFGNVTLEAMASGLAVVAYNYAAAQMHLTHGESGILVPYGEQQAFIDAAVSLAREPHVLPRIRQQARAHALTLTWQDVVDRFVALLTGACDQTPGAVAVA
jgi:glycosyltransferase involved in cell wall biosynthesis